MNNIHVRNINDDLMQHLKQQALQNSMSMNKFIVMLLQKAVGAKQSRTNIRHDFDKFSGTWTEAEAKEFEKNTADFAKIDEDLWR